MNRFAYRRILQFLCIAACIGTLAERATPVPGIGEDIVVLRRALESLHPGLYRYNTPEELDAHWRELQGRLGPESTLESDFVEISRFLGAIRCGHTHANFLNQSDETKESLFGKTNKLPFAFTFIDRRMIVTSNASGNASISPGNEIVAIDRRPVREILEAMLPLIEADGANEAKRLSKLGVSGSGEFEAFDVYFPLLFPPPNPSQFRIEGKDLVSGDLFDAVVAPVTSSDRHEALSTAGQVESGPWEFRLISETTGYLRLGTFVTRRLKFDWREFLQETFKSLNAMWTPNLILDIRGNEGGDDAVNALLLRFLVSKPVTLPPKRELLRYVRVPTDLDPYLETWDESFRNREGKVRDAGGGSYTWINAREEPKQVRPGNTPYIGKVYLLVDAVNSSGTFHLAQLLKDSGLASLVGQETGGNQRGTNGGQMFFLRLPHSGIEVDIPLIGSYPVDVQPDAGVMPDVVVQRRGEDIANRVDAELNAALNLIRGSK